jgi:hypothetical protein
LCCCKKDKIQDWSSDLQKKAAKDACNRVTEAKPLANKRMEEIFPGLKCFFVLCKCCLKKNVAKR